MRKSNPTPIKEYAYGIYDGPHATPPESEEGAIFLGIKNITEDGRLDFSEIRYVSENDFPTWTRRVTPQAGDVVLTYEATLHRYAIIPEGFRGCLGRRVALVRPEPKKVDSRFLLYYFLSQQWRSVVEKHIITGATVDRIPLEKLPDFPVVFPSPPHQRSIADVLSAYDDLIENNRRRMALLEHSARLLYQEWFVRLRFPGREHTRVVDGVPKGWEKKKLEALVDVLHGYAFEGEYFSAEPTYRILTTPGNFRIGGGIKIDKLKYYEESADLDEFYVLGAGDLIVTMTDLSKMGDTLGYPAIVPKLSNSIFLHNQRVGKVVPRSDWFPKYFLYFVMCDHRYRHHVVGSATGTTVKHTAPGRILNYSFVMPPQKMIGIFEETMKPVFEQLSNLIQVNEKLRAARDLLLPRLMSGEIEV